jgi:hypothetical protein
MDQRWAVIASALQVQMTCEILSLFRQFWLVKARIEKRYVDILVTNDATVFPGRARIAAVSISNVQWE